MASWTDYLKTYGLPTLTGGLSAVYTGIDRGDITKDDVAGVLDPGDFSGRQTAKDTLEAGKQAQEQLKALSDQAWARQMQGLQLALGSMNNYNGVLANLYGVPTNYYDPSQMGGIQGSAPWASHAPPAAPPPIASTGPAYEARKGPGHF